MALFEAQDTRRPGPVPYDDAGEPDYYLEGASLTRFNANGVPYQKLDTPRLVHTPIDDVTRARTPVARLYDDQGRIWFGYGDTGILGPEGRHLTLEGNARLQAPEEGWQLETNVLHFDTETGHAWSNTQALLQQPPQHVRGEHFDAWINENRMRLTDNVRGFHPPQGQEEQAP